MKICNIGGCNKKHEAKGYCKVHYRSFSKYGDALYVEQKRAEQEKNRIERENHKVEKERQKAEDFKNEAEEIRQKVLAGQCIAKDCFEPIKSKRLCEKHYARFLRKGSLELKHKRNEIDTEECLVIGCNNPHVRHGFCSTHIINVRENETPYRPKIIKLCGVKGCENEHMGIGLCK